MFKIIYSIVIYFTLIFSLYYVITAVFAFLKKPKIKTKVKKNYFAILIAARNEEKVIKSLIESLKQQDYDKYCYEINVIINNCTDNTLDIASSCGANIIKCDIPITCKGDALKYAFAKLKNNSKIDAYVIFDADNVVHHDFLKHMNNSLNSGYKVAQGTRETKNLGRSWISSSYAIYYYLQNLFFSKSRNNIGVSTTINGTGFMVAKEIIDKIGFNTTTLTEDIEFSGICALNNIKIDYVEEAVTYDEQPITFSVSWKQRMRWTKGTLQCFKKYHLKLIRNFFKNFSLSNIDVLFLYMSPIIQIASFTVISVDIVVKLITLSVGNYLELYMHKDLISFIISYLTFLICSIFVVAYNKHKVKEALSGVLLFIVFIISWLPINIVCLFKKKLVWAPIKHDNNVSIDEIVRK